MKKNITNQSNTYSKSTLGKAAKLVLLTLLFVLVFSAMLSSIIDGNFFSLNDFAGKLDGSISSDIDNSMNVADAAVYGSTVIDLSNVFSDTSTSAININPDINRRGRSQSTDSNHTAQGTWNSTTWSIGNRDRHTGTDYAHIWFDFDLGENWNKLSNSVNFSLSGSLGRDANIISGYIIAIGSSNSLLGSISDTDGGGNGYDSVKNNNSLTKTGTYDTGTRTLNHNVTGRYVRIYFVTYSEDGRYGSVSFSNISVNISRTLKPYSIGYSANGGSGSIGNTAHSFMSASNVSNSYFTNTNFYQTGWNTDSNGSGIPMAFGATTGSSTANGTFGALVKSNLIAGRTTTQLHAVWRGIDFRFYKTDYTSYNNQTLTILQTKTNVDYISIINLPSGYSGEVRYNGSSPTRPTSLGEHTSTLTIKNSSNQAIGTRTINFMIIDGDFGKIGGSLEVWGSKNNPYVISTPLHLRNLSGIVNGTQLALNSIAGVGDALAGEAAATEITFENCYFVVSTRDGDDVTIDMQGIAFVPIANAQAKAFRGSIDGKRKVDSKGSTIANLFVSVSDHAGLFGYLAGRVSNLTVGGTVTASGNYAGGFAAEVLSGGTISNCTNYANITANAVVGGIVGKSVGAISGCANNGLVSAKGSVSIDGTASFFGGIVGHTTSTVANCINSGRVATVNASGAPGFYNNSDRVGGIAGHSSSSITYCYNSGEIFGASGIGGIAGRADGTVNYCYNSGKINSLWNNSGAQVGSISGAGGAYVNNTWDIGTISNNSSASPTVTFKKANYQVFHKDDLHPTSGGASFTRRTWNEITAYNIDGFLVAMVAVSGKYIRSTSDGTTYFAPSAVDSGAVIGDNNHLTFDVEYKYLASVTSNITVLRLDIGGNNANVVYNADLRKLAPITIAGYLVRDTYFDTKWTNGENSKRNVQNTAYSVFVDVIIQIGGVNYSIGRRNDLTLTITKQPVQIVNTIWKGAIDKTAFNYVYSSAAQGIAEFSVNGIFASDASSATKPLLVTATGFLTGNSGAWNWNTLKYSGIGSIDANKDANTYSLKITLQNPNYQIVANGSLYTVSFDGSVTFSWRIRPYNISIGTGANPGDTSSVYYLGKSKELNDNYTWMENGMDVSAALPFLMYNYGKSTVGEFLNSINRTTNFADYLQIYMKDADSTKSKGIVDNGGTISVRLDGLNDGDAIFVSGKTVRYVSFIMTAGGNNFTGSVSLGTFLMNSDFGGGDGTELNPYLISHWAHLLRLTQIVSGDDRPWDYTGAFTFNGKILKQVDNEDPKVGDINKNIGFTIFSRSRNVTVGPDFEPASIAGKLLYGFKPIGRTAARPFSGTYDGGGHINTLDLSLDMGYGGLFGYLNSATIKNVVVNGKVLLTKNFSGVAGIAGYITNNTLIQNSVNNAMISSVTGATSIGGIVGYSINSQILNCLNTGSINGSTDIGGIVGTLASSTMDYAVNTGLVSGTTRVGGIVGNITGSGNIEHCYNLFSVGGADGVAGARPNDGSTNKSFTVFKETEKPVILSGLGFYLVYSISGATLSPILNDGTLTEWNNIVSQDIVGFKFAITNQAGWYLDVNDNSVRRTMSSDGDKLKNGKDTVIIEVSYNFTNQDGNNISLITKNIEIESHTLLYDGKAHSLSDNPKNATFAAKVPSAYATLEFLYWFDGVEFSIANPPTDAHIYVSFATISIGGQVVGRRNNSNISGTPQLQLEIRRTPIDISASGADSNKIKFGYAGLHSNHVPISFGGNSYGKLHPYDSNTTVDAIVKALVYSNSIYYNNGNFVLYYDAVAHELELGSEYSVVLEELVGMSVKSVVATLKGVGNYMGELKIAFILMDGDFDVEPGKVKDATWGSADNPYIINHWAHLIRLSQIVNGVSNPWDSVSGKGIYIDTTHPTSQVAPTSATNNLYQGGTFKQTVNVSEKINASYGFAPIGRTASLPFSGTYDGNGKSIENISISMADHAGLFGYFMGVLKQLTVRGNVAVTGSGYAGGIVGELIDGSIEDCTSYVAVSTSTGSYIGGIVGIAHRGSISNCINNGTVSGNTDVGGIVGRQNYATVSSCTNNAAIRGTNYVGGIVGNITASGILERSENFGSVTGTGDSFVGGIVGRLTSADATLSGGNNSGVVTGKKFVGGIVGENNGATMQGTFVNRLNANILSDVSGSEKIGGIAGSVKGAISGSYTNYANILLGRSYNYAGGIFGYINGVNFEVGVILTNTGTVQGNDYVGGLIGYMTGGKLSNVSVSSNGDVTGGSFVGGIAGRIDGTEIVLANPVVSGRITANGSNVGALFGSAKGTGYNVLYNQTPGISISGNKNFILLGSGVRANVSATSNSDNVGGLVGYLERLAIYSTSWLTKSGIAGRDYIGGVVGKVGINGVLVGGVVKNTPENSLQPNFKNTYSVTGRSYVGGIIGGMQSGAGALVDGKIYAIGFNSWFENTGAIVGTGNYVGGIVGGFTTTTDYFTQFLAASTNTANVTGIDYVGGLFGAVQKNNLIKLNSNGSYNGNATVSKTISGRSYIGGITGLLDNDAHEISKIYSIGLIRASGSYAGGLIGRMNGGSISNSFVTPFGNITINTSVVAAVDFAGGLVGRLESGSLISCYSQGFKFSSVTPSNSGVCGSAHETSGNIVNTWSVYVVANPTYKTTSTNKSGKYVILHDTIANLMDLEKCKTSIFIDEKITLALSLPAQVNNNPDDMYQRVFYDASGYDQATKNKFELNNSENKETMIINIDFKFSSSCETFSVCSAKIIFNSVSDYKNIEEWNKSYVKPNNDSRYKSDITNVALDHPTNPTSYTISGNIWYQDIANDGSTAKVGIIKDVKFTMGSSSAPILITNQNEWNAFASSVRGGNNFAGKYLKLKSNQITVTLSNMAGLHTVDSDTNNFHGTFDGDGHTLNANISGSVSSIDNRSIFPNAGGAVFKNLTVSGTIVGGKYDVAAFVGKPRGRISFYNCTNNVNITDVEWNAGGFVGFSNGQVLEFVDCVNNGNISAYNNLGTGAAGSGGIIGGVAGNSISIDSCLNTGSITADVNVGGLVGRTNNSIKITNSANKGYIYATRNNDNTNSNAGGIVGFADSSMELYASYNSGTVVANVANSGGLIGKSSSTAKIFYCYNTGDVYSGSLTRKNGVVWKNNGGMAGGIVGEMKNSHIKYCYNTGKITANGTVGVQLNWNSNVAGIVGYGQEATVEFCYNVGLIVQGDKGAQSDYFGGILGQVKNPTSSNCYSLANQCWWQDYEVKGGKNDKEYSDGRSGPMSSIDNGTLLDSLADFTSVYTRGTGAASNGVAYTDRILPMSGENNGSGLIDGNNNNSFGVTGSALTLVDGNGNDTTDAAFETGTLAGWIYPYGCLPQLAIFALDTKNGLSMRSTAYDQDQYGNFVKQRVGEEYSPYIIKDGVDMLSLTALNSATRGDIYWNGKNKYIEFADGTNNSAKDVSTFINMTSMTSSQYPDSANVNAYRYNDRGTWKMGRSYHILGSGALLKDRPAGGDLYGDWKARNWNDNGTSSTKGAGLDTVNYYPAGMYGELRFFGANISGLQKNGTNTEIRNLKIDYTDPTGTAYVGLFGRVQDATISNITVSGSIVGRTRSRNANHGVYVGGIAGYTGNSSVISGCSAGTTANPLRLSADTAGGYTSVETNVGGIVGRASTDYYRSASDSSGIPGAKLIIENCVSYANIKSFKDSVGGIIGRADGDRYTSIYISNCKTLGGVLESTKSANSVTGAGANIGGICGSRNDTVSLAFVDCSVGDSTKLSPTTVKVTIRGENAVGGIIAGANGDTTLRDCGVYGDVKLVRQEIGGTAPKNHTRFGTAFGGIVGYTDGSCKIDGKTTFAGLIDVDDYVGSQKTMNIGGIIGLMGSGASIASGNINITGTIEATLEGTENIGGVAGLSGESLFSGTYSIMPTINAVKANNVGGFIGKNDGLCIILANNVTVKIGGDITKGERVGSFIGKSYVGGFVGLNSAGATLNFGVTNHAGNIYTGTCEILNFASVDGSGSVGGIVGSNLGTINGIKANIANRGKVGTNNASKGNAGTADDNCFYGGVVGVNNAGATINFGEQMTLENSGQIGLADVANSYQRYVGGIIGSIAGIFATSGTMQNLGAVYGYQFVGGAIGILREGTIGGTYLNDKDGTVTGFSDVGGIIGEISVSAIIANARFTNNGAVTATNTSKGASASTNTDISDKNVRVGGVIAVFYGTIEGDDPTTRDKIERAEFYNNGAVKGYSYVGGSVGVLAGTVNNALFVNKGILTAAGGDAIGGSIGIICETDGVIVSVPTKATVVRNTRFEYLVLGEGGTAAPTDSKTTVTANGESTARVGGVGGVIGIINAKNIRDLNNNGKSDEWVGNSFYVAGNVTAPKADNVGGVVGKIDGSFITITNMLAYENTITGRNNVGGIVGFNGSTNLGTGVNASLIDCYNVRGIVEGKDKVGGIVGGIAGVIGGNSSPKTYGSFWLVEFSNEQLQDCDGNDLNTANMKKHVLSPIPNHVIQPNEGAFKIGTGGYLAGITASVFGDEYIAQYLSKAVAFYNANIPEGEKPVATGSIQSTDGEWRWYTLALGQTIYSTGSVEAGFYFAYAADAISAAGVVENINTKHSDLLDLNYWKFIASAYASEEIQPSDMKSPIALPGGGIGGSIEKSHIYATILPAKNPGFYCYMKNSISDEFTTSTYNEVDEKFYVNVNTKTAGNILLFYKKLSMISNITYNGRERFAPVTGLKGYVEEITADEIAKLGYGSYYYVLNNTGDANINTGTDIGKYGTSVNIYFVDATLTKRLVGTIDSTLDDKFSWNITRRVLTIDSSTMPIDGTGEYSGKPIDNYVKVTVGNIAGNDKENDSVKFGFKTNSGTEILTINDYISVGMVVGKVYRKIDSGSFMSGQDGQYNVGNSDNLNSYTYEYYLYFVDAGEYSVVATKKATDNYTSANTQVTLKIGRKLLTVTQTFFPGSTGQSVYNGINHGVNLKFSSFAVGENGDTSDKGRRIIDMLNDTITASSSNGTTISSSIATNDIKRSGRDISLYTMAWSESEIGTNYKIVGGNVSWSIVAYEAGITWNWTQSTTFTYNGFNRVFEASIEAIGAAQSVFLSEEEWKAFTSAIRATLAPITDASVEVSSVWKANEHYKAKIAFTVILADTYTARISTAVNSNLTIAEKTQQIKIGKAPLSVTPTFSTGGPTYNYSSYHQGLTSIVVDGLVGKDIGNFDTNLSKYNPNILSFAKTGTGYDITGAINAKEYLVEFRSNSQNYEMTKVTYTWSIVAVELTLTPQPIWNGTPSYIYNTTHQGLNSVVIGGIKGSDSTTAAVTATTNGAKNVSITNPNGTNRTFSFSNAIDVGSYVVTFKIATGNNNYKLASNAVSKVYGWSIAKKVLNMNLVGGTETFVYDGFLHKIRGATIEGLSGEIANDGTLRFSNDTIKFVFDYATGNKLGACNVGKYDVTIGSSGVSAIRSGSSTSTTANYDFSSINNLKAGTINITPCTITLTWNANDQGYVFGSSATSPKLTSGTFSSITRAINDNRMTGIGSESVIFALDINDNINVGNYTAVATVASVSGTNAGGQTVLSNYEIVGGESQNYKIIASIVSPSVDGNVTKVYDATTSYTGAKTFSFVFVSANGGAIAAEMGKYTVTFEDANVGIKKNVSFSDLELMENPNYTLAPNSARVSIGTITPRPLTVSLYTRSGGIVFKTYNKNNVYASLKNRNGEDTAKSLPYRVGQGLNGSGFATAEIDGMVEIVATFAEADKARKEFDTYVNNVIKTGSGGNLAYSIGSGNYKSLVFTLSGANKANYTFAVETYHNVQSASTITVFDSRDEINKKENTSTDRLTISIETAQMTASYSNTMQSYVDENYNFKQASDYANVEGSTNIEGINVEVTNNWREEFKKYTEIVGRVNGTTGLSAVLRGGNGLHLNYVLKNQPTVVIGYFVDNKGYEVGTLVDLMLASYYYEMTMGGGAPSITKYEWKLLCSEADYNSGANIPNTIGATEFIGTWDEYFIEFETWYNAQDEKVKIADITISYDGVLGQWGYFNPTKFQMQAYLDFIQTNNISGIVTASDLLILDAQFGTDWGKGTNNLQNFLKTKVGNVMTVEGGIFAGMFSGLYNGHGYTINNFNIMFVAGGGVNNVGMFQTVEAAEDIIIVDETGREKPLKLKGAVKNINLRNFNIQSYGGNFTGVLNVGGIVGHNLSIYPLDNSSFHGSIMVEAPKSTVNVGGLVGLDECKIEINLGESITSISSITNALAIGNITVNGNVVNAGGIVGSLGASGVQGQISDVVSMMEVFAKFASTLNIGGIIGKVVGTVPSSTAEIDNIIVDVKAYLNGSILDRNNKSMVNKYIGNQTIETAGISYSELRSKSISAYGVNGYIGETETKGKYDVLKDDNLFGKQKAHESNRLCDIIDIYVLQYSLRMIDFSGEIGGWTGVKVYQKSSSSWLVGSATGTDTNKIKLAYQQHVGLLRMFRFASFDLNQNIDMYAYHTGETFVGAFYGSVDAHIDPILNAKGYSIKWKDFKGSALPMFEFELNVVPVSK